MRVSRDVGREGAETPPPLAFAETGVLTTSCELLEKGVNVVIRNETATVQRLNLVVDELVDTKKARHAAEEACGGIEAKLPSSVPPGVSVTARLNSGNAEAAELSGQLSLFAGKGMVARREISISPKAPKEELAVTPLVGSKTAKLTAPSDGPIWIPVEKSSGKVAEGVERQTVGALVGTNGNVAVLFSGEARSSHGSDEELKLELATDGLPPGAYSGKVDLNPGDPEKGEVTLDLKVSRCAWIAVLFLAIGIGAALLLQRLTGRRLPRIRLRGQIERLTQRHEDLVEGLESAAAGKSWGGFAVDTSDLERLKGVLDEQVEEASRRVAIQIDKKVLESLEAKIAVAEAELDLLAEIPPHAVDLETELDKLLPDPGDLGMPDLDQAARAALNGHPIRADHIKSAIEEIDARAKQVQSLLILQQRLGELADALAELERKGAADLEELEDELGVARRLLWEAKAAEQLESGGEQLQKAAVAIAEAFEKLPERVPVPGVVLRQTHLSGRVFGRIAFAEENLDMLSESAAAVEVLEGPGTTPAPPPSLPAQPPAPRFDAEGVRRETGRARWAQGVAVGVAAVVAIATGLAALYTTNETWGSCWDYLAAAIWGLGAQATVAGLATAMDGFSSLDKLGR